MISLWPCSQGPVPGPFSPVSCLHLCRSPSCRASLQRTVQCFLQPFQVTFKNFAFFLLHPSSKTHRGPLTLQIILALCSGRGPGRGRFLPSGSLSYLKGLCLCLEWGVIFDAGSDVSHGYSWRISNFCNCHCILVFSSFYFLKFPCLRSSVLSTRIEIENPFSCFGLPNTRLLLPAFWSPPPLGRCHPRAASRQNSSGAVLSTQSHRCPYSSTGEHHIRWVMHQFMAWTGKKLFVSSFSDVIRICFYRSSAFQCEWWTG